MPSYPDAALLAAMDELFHKERVRDVLFEYSRAVDRLDFDAVAAVYWPEAADDHGFSDGSVSDFIAVLKDRWTNIPLQRHVSNVSVKVDGDYAESVAYQYNWTLAEGPLPAR